MEKIECPIINRLYVEKKTGWNAVIAVFTMIGVIGGLVFNAITLMELQHDRDLRAEEVKRREIFDKRLQEERLVAAQKPVVVFAHEFLLVGPTLEEFDSFQLLDRLAVKNFGGGAALEVTVHWQPDDGTFEGSNDPLMEEHLHSLVCVTRPSRVGAGETTMLYGFPNLKVDASDRNATYIKGTGRIEYEDVEGAKYANEFRFTVQAYGDKQLMFRITQPRKQLDFSPSFY